MGHKTSRKVYIEWKHKMSSFALVNKEVITEANRRIGSAVTSVKKMLAMGEEQEVIMKQIIGADPTIDASDWTTQLAKYWHSISVPISSSGREIETGWEFDINSDRCKVAIKELGVFKSSADLAKKCLGSSAKGVPNIEETNLFRYGMPIEPDEYMLWRYCLVYRDVANTMDDAHHGHIRFYLRSQDEIDKVKRNKFDSVKKAMGAYMDLIADRVAVDNLLHVMANDAEVTLVDNINIDNMEDIDKDQLLHEVSQSIPDKFITMTSDKTLSSKAFIERLISAGILRRLSNTAIIVDAGDVEKTVGDSLIEAVAWFANSTNTKSVSEYKLALKSLPKT